MRVWNRDKGGNIVHFCKQRTNKDGSRYINMTHISIRREYRKNRSGYTVPKEWMLFVGDDCLYIHSNLKNIQQTVNAWFNALQANGEEEKLVDCTKCDSRRNCFYTPFYYV